MRTYKRNLAILIALVVPLSALASEGWDWTTQATPGAQNLFDENQENEEEITYDDGDLSDKIILSEVMPNPEGTDTDTEWIEIYNPTNRTVKLVGLKLCDILGKIHCFPFSQEESISAFSYKSFEQTSTRITLNNDGDGGAILDDADNVIFETELFESSSEGESFSLFGSNWKWTNMPTKNTPNIFVSTLEKEAPAKKKTSKKKTSSSTLSEKETEAKNSDNEVKAAETIFATGENEKEKGFQIGKKEIGWGSIVLAIFL